MYIRISQNQLCYNKIMEETINNTPDNINPINPAAENVPPTKSVPPTITSDASLPEEKEKTPKKRMIVAIIIALFVLSGIGTGIYFLTRPTKPDDTSTTPTTSTTSTEVENKEEKPEEDQQKTTESEEKPESENETTSSTNIRTGPGPNIADYTELVDVPLVGQLQCYPAANQCLLPNTLILNADDDYGYFLQKPGTESYYDKFASITNNGSTYSINLLEKYFENIYEPFVAGYSYSFTLEGVSYYMIGKYGNGNVGEMVLFVMDDGSINYVVLHSIWKGKASVKKIAGITGATTVMLGGGWHRKYGGGWNTTFAVYANGKLYDLASDIDFDF